MQKFLLFFIRFYQLSFSYFLGRGCRFLPTCSEYAAEAIDRYGVWVGCYLAVRRILRCHPFICLGGGSGYDPVPDRDSA